MATKPTIEHVEASLKRWRTRLNRAVTAINKLERQRKRLLAAPTKAKPPIKSVPELAAEMVGVKPDDLSIPGFLQRKKLDPVAEQIAAEQAETKKLKARGRIEKMKAKRSGDLKKMPLSGKAALAAIDNA